MGEKAIGRWMEAALTGGCTVGAIGIAVWIAGGSLTLPGYLGGPFIAALVFVSHLVVRKIAETANG